MDIKIMSSFTLLLREKLGLRFPFSDFPNAILSENQFINLPPWATSVYNRNLASRETLQIFRTVVLFHASIFYFNHCIASGGGGSIVDGGGGRCDEDFRVRLFPRTFLRCYRVGGARIEELSEDSG